MMTRIKGTNTFNRILEKVKIISAQNGSLKAEFKVTEDYMNEHQKVHSGFIVTAVDVLTATGLKTLLKGPDNFVSLEMHFRFLQPARLGDEIIVETKTLKKGKSLCFVEAELRNKLTNDLVAKGAQVLYLLNR